MKRIEAQMGEAEDKAWKALARYKFWMFGYHAAQWVLLNRLLPKPKRNPFRALVQQAREKSHDT